MTTESNQERRKSPRVKVEMWVEESRERETYFQRSANLSLGGIFLDRTIPHPLGTTVTLKFTLPSETEILEVQGTIVNIGPDGEPFGGMGIRFLDLPEGTRARIESWVRAHENDKAP